MSEEDHDFQATAPPSYEAYEDRRSLVGSFGSLATFPSTLDPADSGVILIKDLVTSEESFIDITAPSGEVSLMGIKTKFNLIPRSPGESKPKILLHFSTDSTEAEDAAARKSTVSNHFETITKLSKTVEELQAELDQATAANADPSVVGALFKELKTNSDKLKGLVAQRTLNYKKYRNVESLELEANVSVSLRVMYSRSIMTWIPDAVIKKELIEESRVCDLKGDPIVIPSLPLEEKEAAPPAVVESLFSNVLINSGIDFAISSMVNYMKLYTNKQASGQVDFVSLKDPSEKKTVELSHGNAKYNIEFQYTLSQSVIATDSSERKESDFKHTTTDSVKVMLRCHERNRWKAYNVLVKARHFKKERSGDSISDIKLQVPPFTLAFIFISKSTDVSPRPASKLKP